MRPLLPILAIIIGLALALLSISCGKQGGEFCNSTIQLGGESHQPRYEFTGGEVLSISVVRTSNPEEMVWGMASPDRDGIASPVEHGINPPPSGAVITAKEERTLKGAVRYRVRIARLSGEVCTHEFVTP